MSRRCDPRLCLVTDAALTGTPALERVVEKAVEGGATMVQLRDPHCSDAALVVAARRLKAVLAGTGVPLLVNDRVEVALAVDAEGTHVGQNDMPPARARALLGPDRLLGLSITHPAQIAGRDQSLIDYAGLGPVFATASKPDAAPPLGLGGLAAAAARLEVPVVAIGGIQEHHVAALKGAGAAGVAVISAICGAVDPAAATRALRRAFDRARAGRPEPS